MLRLGWMIVVFGSAMIVSGCATAPGAAAPAATPTASTGTQTGQLECREEQRTGSSIARTKCRSADQAESNRKNSQKLLGPMNGRSRPGAFPE
jgi:NAD(P)H-hydrate repair Nnr-like enzyme with NAD(P)H-hydrate dehydratase domain